MAGNHGEKHSPLDQFKLEKIFDINIAGIDVSFTNSSLFMLIAIGCIIGFFIAERRTQAWIEGRDDPLF